MSCTYEAEPISFQCITTIISQLRTDGPTTLTGRMLLKQIDSGLAYFGPPATDVVTTAEAPSVEEVCQKIEQQLPEGDFAVLATPLELLALLMKLWELLKPILK